jgi:hypothetical protein
MSSETSLDFHRTTRRIPECRALRMMQYLTRNPGLLLSDNCLFLKFPNRQRRNYTYAELQRFPSCIYTRVQCMSVCIYEYMRHIDLCIACVFMRLHVLYVI